MELMFAGINKIVFSPTQEDQKHIYAREHQVYYYYYNLIGNDWIQ